MKFDATTGQLHQPSTAAPTAAYYNVDTEIQLIGAWWRIFNFHAQWTHHRVAMNWFRAWKEEDELVHYCTVLNNNNMQSYHCHCADWLLHIWKVLLSIWMSIHICVDYTISEHLITYISIEHIAWPKILSSRTWLTGRDWSTTIESVWNKER